MKNLIKAEWFKLSKSFGFKMLLLYNVASLFTSSFLIAIGFVGLKVIGYKAFVGVFRYVMHHTFIGYLLVSIFLCEEFSNCTFRMSLLCGYSRRKIFLAKFCVFLLGFLSLVLLYTGITTIVTSIGNGGFGQAFNMETCKNIFVLLLHGVLGYATMGAIMVFIAVIVKKALATVGVGMISWYALAQTENLTRESPLPFLKYTYLYQIRNLYWGQELLSGIFLPVMLITFFSISVASIMIFERTELK